MCESDSQGSAAPSAKTPDPAAHELINAGCHNMLAVLVKGRSSPGSDPRSRRGWDKDVPAPRWPRVARVRPRVRDPVGPPPRASRSLSSGGRESAATVSPRAPNERCQRTLEEAPMAQHPTRPPTTPPKPRMIFILGSVAGITIAALGPAIAAPMAHAPKRTSTSAATPSRATATAPGTPRFFNYASPPGTADNAGEPSHGINWLSERTFSNSAGPIPNGGAANYFGGFLPYMVKVTFSDCQSPALATWEQKPVVLPATPRVFGDPILFTDHTTGRTFVSQLEGLTPLGSTTEFTDNDGDTFSPSEGSGLPSCIDHQTFGGGPFHAPLTPTSLYPHAIYYASQCITDATCAISLDGGVTFAPGVPMFTVADCDGLHGHIKVAPDGTVYVPDKACATASVPLLNGGQAAAIVPEANGATWSIRPIPDGSSQGEWDPSIGIATDGTVYLGYQAIDGHAHIAVSHDRGLHWSPSYDVGAQLGIQNIVFPAVVAGDPDRAAFAFYGTTTADGPGEDHTGGDNDDPSAFSGIWYLYIATTFDGGQTWTTQNVTPGDPIQRGPICHGGDCRNMLDFFDASIDKEGRVLVGWDDGCIGGCTNGPPNSFTAKATITRQSGGRRMFAVFDPVEPRIPEAPGPTGNLVNSTVHLSWPAPDD